MLALCAFLLHKQVNGQLLLAVMACSLFIFEYFSNHEKALDLSPIQELTNLLFYHSPSMIVKIDISDWKVLEINDMLSSTLNVVHPFQVIGQPIFNLFSEEEVKKLNKALHTLKRKGSLHQYAAEILTIDGNKIQVTLDGVISSTNEERRAAYIYITNISSIKKIESKLEANRNLLQNIIDNTLEAVIITNKNGKIIDWNPQASQLIGQGKNNVINKSISRVIVGDNDSHLALEKDISNYLKNEKTRYIGKRVTFTIINYTNKKIPVESCCFPVLSDDGSYIFCFFLHDITTELKAREQEMRLSTIVKQTEDAIVSLDANFQVDSWNNGATKMFGHNEQDVHHKPIYDYLTKSHAKLLENKLNKVISSNESLQYEFSLNDDASQYKYYMVSLNLINYAKDNVGISMIIKDISELKRNEIMIRELMSELEASNKELQSFAYIASHDLKEPLRGIKNYAIILKDEYAEILDESGVGFLNSLIKSCSRLELLLESLLHYSKVGNLQLSLKNIDANHIVNDVKDAIHHMLSQKNATVIIEEQLPHVLADESRLSEIFTNLITNGLKYNDKEKPIIKIGLFPDKTNEETVCIYVKDNGIGIEKAKLDSVFQIFQRLHKKDEYGGGAGAGLTITKRIVERLKGNIWIESIPGDGSTFFFTLLKSDETKPISSMNTGVELLIKSDRDSENGINKNPVN